MEWYLKVIKEHYADFNGRARRQEYWMFTLINILVSLVLAVVDYVLGTGFIGSIYSLAVLLPGLAVSVRRLHDLGKSGWLLLLALIPLVGAIILLVWFATEGNAGSNEYGKDPKNPHEDINEIGQTNF
ncbi:MULTISPECIES: DUF805 domain-containing protein [Myroides]|uniref:DUF805 domain-containing protein n=1 Tax=Myroides albus TaxID=2562892 RepID=A0A6I3LFX5_9FLAO|nr:MULTISPECIES: DUF805 domain-containing protein [Myroides]MTG96767.1 DUF805 domain-containing protein [Myroides albus]MVX36469.1 DUF805 domain-containing protein [Myroides sp. LoEW2-1]UVD80821.1 DUF805 domain-containing protein [Myroides albus]